MKKKFIKSWKGSVQPRKQKKFRYCAPLHIRTRFMHATLSKELREKYSRRNIPARKGDRIKVLRGEFRGKIGKIEKVDLKAGRIYITGIEKTKRDGSKSFCPVYPSKVMVMEMELKDSRRLAEKAKKKE